MVQGLRIFSDALKARALELEKEVFPETASADPGKLVVVSENDKAAQTSEKGLSISHPLVSDSPDAGPEEKKYFSAACGHSEKLLFSSLTGWSGVIKAYAGVTSCGSAD
jgi:hypothetical protein